MAVVTVAHELPRWNSSMAPVALAPKFQPNDIDPGSAGWVVERLSDHGCLCLRERRYEQQPSKRPPISFRCAKHISPIISHARTFIAQGLFDRSFGELKTYLVICSDMTGPHAADCGGCSKLDELTLSRVGKDGKLVCAVT